MNKGILIIGGGLLQIPAILRAKELGYITHLTDINSKCAASSFADKFYNVDINDFEATAKLAKDLSSNNIISGVYTQGTDAEYTVAYAADKSNLLVLGLILLESVKIKY